MPRRRALSAARLLSATSVGGANGNAIITVAKTAFVHGMSHGLEVGAVFIAASAIVALIWLPNRVIQADEAEDNRSEAGLEGEDVACR